MLNLIQGDCLEKMKDLPENSIDAIVTDPPYGLSFMGKDWDHGVPGVPFWQEALRVAKPGCHLLAFGGTRTYHRLACAIEDAGWEIRDCIMWVYGSGFPKSLDVSKAIGSGDYHKAGSRGGTRGREKTNGIYQYRDKNRSPVAIPTTDSAKQWDGWGTALKPAYEPIILARKPVEGTIAGNVLKWKCGGMNIDGCRVPTSDVLSFGSRELGDGIKYRKCTPRTPGEQNAKGRWPANFIHDGSEEVVNLFPVTGPSSGRARNNGEFKSVAKGRDLPHTTFGHEDNGGSAARFFYCSKASNKDRGEGNLHPTVKPTSLMQYLCRLVTPPGGTVLDPFMGSGSTGKAAILEGFNFTGIELDPEYVAIAWGRLNKATEEVARIVDLPRELSNTEVDFA